jgi:hypothetical protein
MNIFSSKYLLFILLILPLSVKATPFHIDDQSGYQGSSVTLELIDELTDNLEAADLRISYDPTKLSFTKGEPGSVRADLDALFIDDPINGFVNVSVITSLPSSIDQKTGSLLSVTFDIFPNAIPGNTDVSIECLNYAFLSPTPCQKSTTAYFVPATVGRVNILAKTTDVPEPEIFLLMLLGLFYKKIMG